MHAYSLIGPNPDFLHLSFAPTHMSFLYRYEGGWLGALRTSMWLWSLLIILPEEAFYFTEAMKKLE